jgi:hypothetical protein
MSDSTTPVPSQGELERVAAWLRTNGVVDSATFAQLNKGVEHHRQIKARRGYEEQLVEKFLEATSDGSYAPLQKGEKKMMRIGISAVLDKQISDGWVRLSNDQKGLLGDVITYGLYNRHSKSEAIREHLVPLFERAGVELS